MPYLSAFEVGFPVKGAITSVDTFIFTSSPIAAVSAEGDWLVSVMTAEAEHGGLDSQAMLTVFAANGESVSTLLGHPGIGLFRSGACDQFTVSILVV